MLIKFIKDKYHYIALLSILVFLFFQYFYGIFYYQYPVPPGDDCMRHMTEAREIMHTGQVEAKEINLDPPHLRILLASITEITGLNIVTATKYIAPLLAVLSVLSIYFLVRQYFDNKKLALLALILCAFISPQPWRIYEDGTYDNLISSAYLLVFALAFLPGLIKNQTAKINYKNIGLVVIFSGAVLLSHSMSAIYLIMILVVLAILLIIKFRKKVFVKKDVLIAYLILLGFVPFIWSFYLADIVEKALSLVGIGEITGRNTLQANFSQSVIGLVPKIGDYNWHLTEILIALAILGLVLLIKFKPNKYFEKWILVIWTGVFLFGSRFEFFQLPTRFARDMFIVVCIFSAILIFQLLKRFSFKSRLLLAFLLVSILSINLSGKITRSVSYNSMIRVQDSDVQAIEWINQNTSPNDTILGIPPTIVAGNWGSFIELFTERETLTGNGRPREDLTRADPIFFPESELSVEYYLNNSIDYVYAGKKILGSFLWKDKIDWTYQNTLSEASFLEPVAVFSQNEKLGSVIIFKVNQNKLQELQ